MQNGTDLEKRPKPSEVLSLKPSHFSKKSLMKNHLDFNNMSQTVTCKSKKLALSNRVIIIFLKNSVNTTNNGSYNIYED